MCSAGLLNSATGALGLQLVAVMAVLAVIAGVAFVSVRFIRPGLLGSGRSGRMKRLETLSLEPRRSLYLVRIDNREMVVGISEGGMQFLEWQTESEKSNIETESSHGRDG